MTPKEKAKELVKKMDVIHYMKLHGKNSNSKGLPISMYDDQIKQCALASVDEILNSVMIWWEIPVKDSYFITQKNYWQEVKEEIELL